MTLNNKIASVAAITLLAACGGGGGGGGGYSGGSSGTVYYPYETVYGDVCSTMEPTPGCTFDRNGKRITVTKDPYYNTYGNGSSDLWYVYFHADGTADVYNNLGVFQYTTSTSTFKNWVSGNTIGVGTSGAYWENVSGGTYWLGKNGVLYSANSGESRYGQAINNKGAAKTSDTDFAIINSENNKALIKAGAAKLVKEYNFKEDKAVAVASALNSFIINSTKRGYTTDRDIDVTFTKVFGDKFSNALAAVKGLEAGNKQLMVDFTNRSASALGLDPRDAQKFIKGMYAKALASWGYDVNTINW